MTRKQIQEQLKARGITQAALAAEAGVRPTTISLFLRKRFKSARLSALLQEKLSTTTTT